MGKKNKNKKRSDGPQLSPLEHTAYPALETDHAEATKEDHVRISEVTAQTSDRSDSDGLRESQEISHSAVSNRAETLLPSGLEVAFTTQSDRRNGPNDKDFDIIEVADKTEQSLLADLVESVSGLEPETTETVEFGDNAGRDSESWNIEVEADTSQADVEPEQSERNETSAENATSVKVEVGLENDMSHKGNGVAEDLHKMLQRITQERDALIVALKDKESILSRTVEEKAQVESQYRSLFGKVTQMKSTLGARLKQDTEDLAQNRVQIEELESQNAILNETVLHAQEQIVLVTEQLNSATHFRAQSDEIVLELSETVANLKDSLQLEQQKRIVAEEHDMITAAEWENLAIEERAARDTLRDRIHDLEEQLSAQNVAYQNLLSIVEQDNQMNSKLKQNIVEIQDSHQEELKTSTAALQITIDDLDKAHKAAQERVDLLKSHNNNLEREMEKVKPYEREAKEKSLLIGKLRHEAVILNEHLTKALRLLKRGSSADSVDRQLLNNLLLSFFQLPRQDSKRFEVLKILASILAWDDVQKEQAGLVRPGSTGQLLTPLSPSLGRSPPVSPSINRASMSRRTSGAIQLQAADFMGPNKESMSDLWINFLQSEAAMNAVDAADTS